MKEDYTSIVISGGWNKFIFTNKWVSKFLFPDEELKVELPAEFDGSLRFTSSKFRIGVINNKLILISIKNDDAILDEMQNLSIKIADYLPHTPVVAFGINFCFEVEETDVLLKLIDCNDVAIMKASGLAVEEINIHRKIKYNNGALNLTSRQNNGLISFEFNYHYNINDLLNFKEIIILNNILLFKLNSTQLIESLYNLKLT